jgi:serine protease inhibitor
MKRLSTVLLLACLGLLCIGGSAPDLPNGEIPPELKPLVEGNTSFALELYSNLRDQEGNLFLSPYSISSALAIAYRGAEGETEQQMAKALHLPLDQDACHAGMAEIRKALATANRKGEVELNVANGLWTQKGYAFRDEFVRFAKKSYDAEVESVDFLGSAGAACRKINAWIERQTKHRIKNAVGPDMVSPATRLVIVNAIYFKGQWASRFDKAGTEPRPFWVSAGESVETPTMSQQSEFRYGEDELLQLLELPYKKNGLSMIIILPKERDSLPQVEKQLTPANLSAWLGRLQLCTVDVLLPKFKIQSRWSLRSTLAAMGMPDAFDGNRADLTGITARRPFFITGVEHAALVEVDEEGTVAAAATVVGGGCSMVVESPPPATFHADHPFIFLIRDNRTGTILFLGKVLDPTR